MKNRKNSCNYSDWHQYIVNPDTSESFIVPFFELLQEVFQSLKIYKNSKCYAENISDNVLRDIIFHDLGQRYFHISKFIFINELKKLKAANLLSGHSSQDRFQSFVQLISKAGYMNALYLANPALKKLINIQKKLFLEFYKEMLGRFSDDYAELKKLFFNNESIQLTKINRAGDIHESGRSVCIFQFLSKKNKKSYRIVYKPKHLGSDVLYCSIYKWCSKQLNIIVRLPQYLYRHDNHYGWMEFIEQGIFENKSSISEYYFKFGVVLAVSYLLLGKDFHAHNIIASIDGPVLIDLECMMTPYISGLSKTKHFLLLNTMLIPQKRMANNNFSGFDVSALSSVKNKYHPNKEYIIENDGMDELKIIQKQRLIPEANNLPIFRGKEADCLSYSDFIEKGFTCCYNLLLKKKSWLINSQHSPLSTAKSIKTRIVFRNTNEYYAKILGSYSHINLTSNMLRKNYFTDLKKIIDNPNTNGISKHEHTMLEIGVIPTFWITSNTKKIMTDLEKTCFSLSSTPFNRFKKHIAAFSLKDLRRQLHTLRQSLYCYKLNQNPIIKNENKSFLMKNSNHNNIENKLKDRLRNLFDLAFIEQESIYWTSIREYQCGRFQVDKTENNLPDGSMGVLLIITLLANAFQLKDMLEEIKLLYPKIAFNTNMDFNQRFNIGFSGMGGNLYAMKIITDIIDFPKKDIDWLRCPIKKMDHIKNDFSYYTGITGFLYALRKNNETDVKKNAAFIERQIKKLKQNIINQLNDKNSKYNFFHGLSSQVYLLSQYENVEIIKKTVLNTVIGTIDKSEFVDTSVLEIALLADDSTEFPTRISNKIMHKLAVLTQSSGPIFSDTYQLIEANRHLSQESLDKIKDKFIFSKMQKLVMKKNCRNVLDPTYLRGTAGLLYAMTQLALDVQLEKITLMGIDR